MYGQGISYVGDILDLAVTGNIIEKSGAWYAYDDMKIGQGRENAKQFLAENDDVRHEVINRVKSFMGLDEQAKEAEA